jgi:hypothetical protein
MKGPVRAFWHWDLVDYPDPTLTRRCKMRKDWMSTVMPHVEIGFCSDGDWIERDTSGKLIKLEQGADVRYRDRDLVKDVSQEVVPILFTGLTHNCGEGRFNFVADMQSRYGTMFHQVAAGIHGMWLLELVRRSMIVVAPDSPVTDRYWSNRVYLILGFGGFLMHPYCEGLTHQYQADHEIVYYQGRDDLYRKVDFYLSNEEQRKQIAMRGQVRTWNEHTYTHRCEKLLNVVKEQICLGRFTESRSVS